MLACLKTNFPEKTFEVLKSTSTKDNTAVAEINLLEESRYIQRVSIAVSDDILLPQANKFKNDLTKSSFFSTAITTNPNIKVSVIEYHSLEQLSYANEIKKIYSNYFRISQISLINTPDVKNKNINIRIKKLNDQAGEKFILTNIKFPKTVDIKNKLSVAFIAGFEQMSSKSNMPYTGKICLEEMKGKSSSARNACKNFSFNKESKVLISEEIDVSNLSSDTYTLKIKIDQLKIDTIIGYVLVTDNSSLNNNIVISKYQCDTVYTYIGPNEDNFLFKGKAYEKNNLSKRGIEISILKKDAKSISINISTGKCAEENSSFYSGETKTITLCDDTKITLTFINSANTSTNRQNNWALFDVILCKPVPKATRRN